MTKAEREAQAQLEKEQVDNATVIDDAPASTNSTNTTHIVEVKNVRIRKEYTAFGKNHPDGHKGKLALPARPIMDAGALVNDLDMEGWVGDDIRVLMTFNYATFPRAIHLPYELYSDGKYEVEDVLILELGQELLRADGSVVTMTEESMKGARQLWIGSYARQIV